ncbi:MAG: MEKHLA domain-containing protein [Steroidobacteraceae bacterium]
MAPHADSALYDLLAGSYRRLAGAPLAPAGHAAAWLYEQAPFALLAHDVSADPRFIYANLAAQACFEYSWSEIVGLPSRLSAGPADRAERQRLLDAVRREGLVRGYRGLRIAKSGRRFWIEDGIVWQLTDARGAECGQAALFYCNSKAR